MPEDGRIDWTKSNIEILRLINVSSEPYEGAFTFLNEIKVIIWRAEIVNDFEAFLAIPGQICKNEKDFIDVACGVGKIRLLNISTTQSITSIRNRFN
jgi:methionyl-tRNA formyltransferase